MVPAVRRADGKEGVLVDPLQQLDVRDREIPVRFPVRARSSERTAFFSPWPELEEKIVTAAPSGIDRIAPRTSSRRNGES